MRIIVLSLVLLAALGTAVAISNHSPAAARQSPFRTVCIEHGNLQISVAATGTLQPEEVIDVGAQVAGQITEFGADPSDSAKRIDYGSLITAGTVLARIDDSSYAAQVQQAKAQFEQAQATVQRAEADVEQAQVLLKQAERDLNRALALREKNAISDAEIEKAQLAFATARSGSAIAQASVRQTARGADVARAVLKVAETNLGYTTITSPIDGVIIDRRVNIGQTVVASLNAPSLFLIAKDLRRMQVWALVNEADIGRIYKGQSVRFTVDAYPDQQFDGEVAQIRLNASMSQNVVAYTVVVSTDNPDGKLLPYLTANLEFIVSDHPDVLMTPNAALRWSPPPEIIVAEHRREPGESRPQKSRVARQARAKPPGAKQAAREGTVWIAEGPLVRPVRVRLAAGNDAFTEIIAEELKAGDEIVIGELTSDRKPAFKNPFTPQVQRDRKAD